MADLIESGQGDHKQEPNAEALQYEDTVEYAGPDLKQKQENTSSSFLNKIETANVSGEMSVNNSKDFRNKIEQLSGDSFTHIK